MSIVSEIAWIVLFIFGLGVGNVVVFAYYTVVCLRGRAFWLTSACATVMLLAGAASAVLGRVAGVGFGWWGW